MTTEPISDERLAEIRAGLEGVTPGPWQRYDGYSEVTKVVRANGWLVADVPWGRAGDGNAHRDAEFIARLDPQTVAALLSRLDKAEAGWRPIETHATDAIKGPYSPHVLCAHAEKQWQRFGRYDLTLKRWYYSGTSERSQWAQVEGDAPTHWMPFLDLPPPPPPSES
jgi:hypothetical protein